MVRKSNHVQGDTSERLLRELERVTRLLTVLLIKAGTSQSEIAAALQIDRANVSRMLPARQFKPFAAPHVD